MKIKIGTFISCLLVGSSGYAQLQPQDKLRWTIMEGDIDRLNQVLKHMDSKLLHWDGETALHFAIRHDVDPAIVQTLLKKDHSLLGRLNKKQENPLQYAVRKGKLENAVRLVELGAQVCSQDHYGETILHYIARKPGYFDIFAMLLLSSAAKKCLNTQDTWGRTPLHVAATWYHKDRTGVFDQFVKTCLENEEECSLNVQDKEGNTVVDVLRKYEQHAAAKTLKEKGARCHTECSWTERIPDLFSRR